MSRLGTKTYSRKPDCRTSIQFDTLLSDKSNKPSTAKVSVAGIHRWGMTSFTSLRKSRLNRQKEMPENLESAKRVKLETRTSPCDDDPFSFNADIEVTVDVPKINSAVQNEIATVVKPIAPKPNKFFKSGGSKTLGHGKSTATPLTNSDFDALRLSVSNCNVLKSDKEEHSFSSNVLSSFKGDVPYSADKHTRLLTNTTPNIVDLRLSVNSSETSASTPMNDFRQCDRMFVKSISFPTSSSSQAFDNLRSITYSSRTDANIGEISNLCYDLSSHMSPELESSVINNNSELELQSNLCSLKAHYDCGDSIVLKENVIEACENKFVLACSHENNTIESSSDKVFVNTLLPSQSSQPSSLSIEDIGSNLYVTPSHQSSQENIEKQDIGGKQIFRPKKIFSSSLKPKAVYNPRHWHLSRKIEQDSEAPITPSLADEFEESDKESTNKNVTESFSDPSFEVDFSSNIQSSKQLYTRIRNVKQAYQCHESGETQEFNDDIEYLLECVQECNGIGTRCLSVLNLAAKCMGPAFRIHLRAHGTMPKIFCALKDAPTDPNLALCTSTLMFVLSQDRLTMDIEASTLSLMLQLLETDPEMRCPEKEFDLILRDPALCAMQDKHREKVYQLCEEMQQKGHAKHLKLNNINTGILAMETLLSLTSRKAGEWFKEEMRTLHGLDHITDTVTSCVALLIPDEQAIAAHANEVQLDRIRKIDRCLRVLENVTYMNFENQEYLMKYKNSSLIVSCLSLMKICKSSLLKKPSADYDAAIDTTTQYPEKNGCPILPCLLSLLKVLINLTHENSLNDSQVASGGLMETVLICILQVPRTVSSEKRFDLLVLSLGLFINLVEYCMENRVRFMEMHTVGSFDCSNDGYEMLASEAVIELMLSRLELARLSEEQADALLSTQEEKHAEKKDIESAAEDLEETLMKTLQKAGKHMEHSIVAAYVAILIGCVIQNNKEYADVLKDQVPDGKFDVMVEVLKKFMSFVSLSGSVGNRGVKSIQRVIQVLESS